MNIYIYNQQICDWGCLRMLYLATQLGSFWSGDPQGVQMFSSSILAVNVFSVCFMGRSSINGICFYLSIYLSTYLSIYPIYLSIYLSIKQSINLSVYTYQLLDIKEFNSLFWLQWYYSWDLGLGMSQTWWISRGEAWRSKPFFRQTI